MAGLHGRIRSAGREIVVSLVQRDATLGVSFGVLRKEKCTGDPVRRLGNDLLFQQLAEANLEACADEDQEDHDDLSALRADHSGGLEGVRHGAADGAPQ